MKPCCRAQRASVSRMKRGRVSLTAWVPPACTAMVIKIDREERSQRGHFERTNFKRGSVLRRGQ